MLQPTTQSSHRRAATRNRLRTAAAVHFRQHGIAATSIDTLCRAAGFSRGAFYSNYESRYDLALELVSENQEAEIAFWLASLAGSADFTSAARALEARFDNVMTQSEWGLLNVELQLEAERDASFGERYQLYLNKLNEHTRVLLRTICAAAKVPVPADIDAITAAVRAFTTGLMLNARLNARLGITNQGASSPGAMIMHFLCGALALEPSATTR